MHALKKSIKGFSNMQKAAFKTAKTFMKIYFTTIRSCGAMTASSRGNQIASRWSLSSLRELLSHKQRASFNAEPTFSMAFFSLKRKNVYRKFNLN